MRRRLSRIQHEEDLTRRREPAENALVSNPHPLGRAGALGNARIQRLMRAEAQRAAAPGPHPMLMQGSAGRFVFALQEMLNDVGSGEALGVDGVFGPLTGGAVRVFQNGNSLDVDGIVGPMTWGALEQRSGKRTSEVAKKYPGGSGSGPGGGAAGGGGAGGGGGSIEPDKIPPDQPHVVAFSDGSSITWGTDGSVTIRGKPGTNAFKYLEQKGGTIIAPGGVRIIEESEGKDLVTGGKHGEVESDFA